MTIGKNAPQIYQYPLILFQGEEPDDINNVSTYAFTPLEVEKVVRREEARIEMLIGKYIFSGFNIWTTQQLDQSYII